MGTKETARRGLRYIMDRVSEDQWEELSGGDFIIYSFGSRGRKGVEYRVPKKNVEEAERALELESIPMRWVHTDIIKLSKKKK